MPDRNTIDRSTVSFGCAGSDYHDLSHDDRYSVHRANEAQQPRWYTQVMLSLGLLALLALSSYLLWPLVPWVLGW